MTTLLWFLLACVAIVLVIYVFSAPFMWLEQRLGLPGGSGIILFVAFLGGLTYLVT